MQASATDFVFLVAVPERQEYFAPLAAVEFSALVSQHRALSPVAGEGKTDRAAVLVLRPDSALNPKQWRMGPGLDLARRVLAFSVRWETSGLNWTGNSWEPPNSMFSVRGHFFQIRSRSVSVAENPQPPAFCNRLHPALRHLLLWVLVREKDLPAL
jgi:hypothetical protein